MHLKEDNQRRYDVVKPTSERKYLCRAYTFTRLSANAPIEKKLTLAAGNKNKIASTLE